MLLNVIWFILMTVLLLVYAILEGFDLGVGILHLFTRKNEHRRILMNSIGPVWDGNEVWLITFGGALFAAFPTAYATVFSAFYTPFMMLLTTLIFRAASMEFRSKVASPAWQNIWDILFSLSSLVATLLLGVASGNALAGIAIDEKGIFQGNFFTFLNPLGVVTGLFAIFLFALQGSLYLQLKTEGELNYQMKKISKILSFSVLILFAVLTTVSFSSVAWARPRVITSVLGLVAIAMLGLTLWLSWKEKGGKAFLSNTGFITSIILIFASNMFPYLVRSSLNPSFSLDIYNSASSPKTLTIMLGIVLVVLPIVLVYTGYVYWVFRGPVKLDETSY